MNKRNSWFFSSLLVLIFALFFLVSGSSILSVTIDKLNTIPLGTFITWAGIISLPLAIYWGVHKVRNPENVLYKYLSIILKLLIILSILWVPISYLLAGNISFSFTEKETFQGSQEAMKWFWRYSYGVAIAPIILLVFHWIILLVKKQNHPNIE